MEYFVKIIKVNSFQMLTFLEKRILDVWLDFEYASDDKKQIFR